MIAIKTSIAVTIAYELLYFTRTYLKLSFFANGNVLENTTKNRSFSSRVGTTDVWQSGRSALECTVQNRLF